MKKFGTIERVSAAVYTIPTQTPESDGTLEWDLTTIVVVHVHGSGKTGIGYSYTHSCIRDLIENKLAEQITGENCMDIGRCVVKMRNCVRNLGETGLTMMALSAVESALWDLKARLLDISLVKLLGPFNSKIQAYGSGGFTTYSHTQLQKQLGRWSQDGFGKVKMKIGSRPDEDTARIKAAREAIGRNCELFVDANGAYSVKQAIDIAGCFERYDVSWYEEPVWHKDLCGLRRVRDNVGAGVNVAAGEYGFELTYFADMLKAGSVDILQADATRCGVSCFIQAASLCGANMIAMSSHCAPTLHLHICCSLPQVIHMEYFYDHVRIEGMLFDGAATADQGYLIPDIGRPGMGIELKEKDAEKYRTG